MKIIKDKINNKLKKLPRYYRTNQNNKTLRRFKQSKYKNRYNNHQASYDNKLKLNNIFRLLNDKNTLKNFRPST